MIRNDPVRLKEIRSRLSDISWWMRLLSQKIGDIGACCHTVGFRSSDKGFLPMSVASYLELLDWTAWKFGVSSRVTPASYLAR